MKKPHQLRLKWQYVECLSPLQAKIKLRRSERKKISRRQQEFLRFQFQHCKRSKPKSQDHLNRLHRCLWIKCSPIHPHWMQVLAHKSCKWWGKTHSTFLSAIQVATSARSQAAPKPVCTLAVQDSAWGAMSMAVKNCSVLATWLMWRSLYRVPPATDRRSLATTIPADLASKSTKTCRKINRVSSAFAIYA